MRQLRFASALVAVAIATGSAGAVEPTATGTVTGLPLPRYVSLKPSDTPMREGPSKEHRIKWVFKREGVPVEITAEFENWRRVRDSEGVEGWVFHSRLSARRTALVAPWSKEKLLTLHDSASETASIVAQIQPTVIASVENCNGKWCRISGEGFRGWMKQEQLWGVYPGELVK